MNPFELIDAHYTPGSKAHRILVQHARQVADHAAVVAARMAATTPVDTGFVREAAVLHDIGMFMTDARQLGCYGAHPYICHGLLGRHLLEGAGLTRHALVCERHVGVGLSNAAIQRQRLPLPLRDMLPQTLEEQIICYVDKFFSKTGPGADRPKPVERVRADLARYGSDTVARFDRWHARFGPVGPAG